MPAYQEAAEIKVSQPTRLALAFLDDSTIVVFVEFRFLARPSDNAPVTPENVHHSSAIFSINTDDLSSGKARVWKDLRGLPPTLAGPALLPTGASGCLLMLDNRLLSLSHNLDEVAKRDLPRNPTKVNGFLRQDQWTVLTDPGTSKALLVRFPFASSEGEARWVSPDSLEGRSPTSVPRWGGTAVLVGDSLVFNKLNAEHQPAEIQMSGEQAHPLCAECFGGVGASFGDGLVFLRGVHGYSVTDSSGLIRYSKKGIGGRADTISVVRGAIKSNRAVYLTGHFGRELKEVVRVVDVDRKKEIWEHELHPSAVTTNVGGFVKESFPSSTVAMSPSGKRVVIASGSTLSIFDIP